MTEPWEKDLTPAERARAHATLTVLDPCPGGRGCSNRGTGEVHTCPYVEELSGPAEAAADLCNCCDDCAAECAADV